MILESDRSRPRDLSKPAVDDSTVDRTSGSCLVEESTGGRGGSLEPKGLVKLYPAPV